MHGKHRWTDKHVSRGGTKGGVVGGMDEGVCGRVDESGRVDEWTSVKIARWKCGAKTPSMYGSKSNRGLLFMFSERPTKKKHEDWL